jgi:hypothetical protein
MLSGSVKGIEETAKREGCSPRKVKMTLSLAFLAPEIVKAAIDGRLPRGVGISRLSDLQETRTPVRRKKIGTVGGARLDLLHSPGERCYPSISGESCRVGT